ncbi:MAG: hypothetical protein M3Y57_20590 [Acidobacteriota bacterium]|nr:hypothetical protein [Acidobacteriota bacterium]
MPSVQTPRRSRRVPAKSSKRPVVKVSAPGKPGLAMSAFAAIVGVVIVYLAVQIHSQYTFNLQSPIRLRFQSPLVVALRDRAHEAVQAQFDQQDRPLTAYQQYACAKFGSACRLALAIQRAENPRGKCEIYHYNTDGTLDWGYFQINTVHLKRPGLNLRDLLNCKANINFAYQLYVEEHGFTAWSTYNSGAYRRYLRE